MRSVAVGVYHYLALGWDGRVYSWGDNDRGQLGHGDKVHRASPVLVEGLEGVRGIAGAVRHSFAVTHSGDAFQWGESFWTGAEDSLLQIIVEGLRGVRVRCVCGRLHVGFAISEHGELFSWGQGKDGLLGYGDKQDQPSPKRIEALRGVRMSGASVGSKHVLALTEDGLLYSWGRNMRGALLGKPNVVRPLLPKPVEALRGVRVGSVLARDFQSYAVADTGEVWAWGGQHEVDVPLGHGEQTDCFLPKPIESLRGVKVDAVGPSVYLHMHVVSDDGSVYTWGADMAAENGALGLGTSVMNAGVCVPTPQRIPALRVACGWL
jgi:alpha-tubulin suppressor-like RCC1 family protein